MNMSIARAGRPATRTLSVAAAAVATVALLAACSGGSDDASSAASDESSASESATTSDEVQVIDQTNLLLQTAQETLEARGLVVQVADASGQGRAIEDPTQWVVVTQEPLNGTVESGSDVTLTVRMTTDPVG